MIGDLNAKSANKLISIQFCTSGPGFQLPQVQAGYNSPQTGYNSPQTGYNSPQTGYSAGQTSNQYQLRNDQLRNGQVLPGMIDGGPLISAYGNSLINPNQYGVVDLNGNTLIQQQQQDVFPYSVDVTNLANYNQYAIKRSDVGSMPASNNQISKNQNRAVTSLTGYSNSNGQTSNTNGIHTGITSQNGFHQPTTTPSSYSTAGVTTTPVYNQLYNGVNSYNYQVSSSNGVVSGNNNYNYGGAGTGIGTGAGATGVTTISSINPYIYKLTKRQSFDAPLDLLAADSQEKNNQQTYSIENRQLSQVR